MVEIGVSMGGSLKMWKDYFGPGAKIYGVDINPDCKQFEEENIEIFIGSQSDRAFLKQLKTKIPKIDILIDDGGHTMEQQTVTFEELFDHISEKGIYLCEDIHTSYLKEYGGGLNKADTFIEFSKHLIDQLHAWHIPNEALPVSNFTRNAESIHFYDGIIVIEKNPHVQPWSEMRGAGLPIHEVKFDPATVERFKLKLRLLGITIPQYTDIGHLLTNPNMLENLLGDRYEGKNWPEQGETMIGYRRLTHLENCVIEVVKNNIPGDFIETGVWRGGACILMASMVSEFHLYDRKVWLADSFKGLPEPDPGKFPSDLNDTLFSYSELAVSLEQVEANLEKYNVNKQIVKYLKGWFKDTMPHAPVQQLSILRVDGDLYESTIEVLIHLYPKLSVGGLCIIDDYGAIPACKKAVEDFRKTFDINELITHIDWTGIFWKKEKQIHRIPFSDFLALTK